MCRSPRCFEPDGITQEVITLVNTRFASHPGTLHSFAWPVTPVDTYSRSFPEWWKRTRIAQ